MEMKLIIRREMGIPQLQICKLNRDVILSNLPFNFVASIFAFNNEYVDTELSGCFEPHFLY